MRRYGNLTIIYRTLLTVWLISGLAWFAGVISTVQHDIEKKLEFKNQQEVSNNIIAKIIITTYNVHIFMCTFLTMQWVLWMFERQQEIMLQLLKTYTRMTNLATCPRFIHSLSCYTVILKVYLRGILNARNMSLCHMYYNRRIMWSSCSLKRDACKYGWPDQSPIRQGCDLHDTFERPENWSERSVVAQTQKVMYLCNYYITTPGATVRGKEAGWVEAEPLSWWLKGCHGRRMEAQWSPQRSLNGRYWPVKGGTMAVQVR